MNLNLEDAHRFLGRTPSVLRSLVDGMPEAWLDLREGPETFSVRDVLGHLCDSEDEDWIPRLEIILRDGESRPFTPFDRWIFRERFGAMTGPRLLDEFAARRVSSLARLDGFRLTPADLARTGTHPDLGRVTLGQLLATWVTHDFSHLAQISRVLAKQYGDAVGPWKAYLSVLSR